MGSPGVDGWDAPLAARWEARGNSPGAEDRYRGSGGDQFERQSGRALALRGGGGGGRRTRRRTRQTELGAGWGLLETCHAGTGLVVRGGTSDRPLIGHPWRPHGGPNQGTRRSKTASPRLRQGSQCPAKTGCDSVVFETDRPHMHNGIMHVKERPFPVATFQQCFQGHARNFKVPTQNGGGPSTGSSTDASFTWSHLVTTGLGRIASFDFVSKDSESHSTASRQELHHGSNAGSAQGPECWYLLIFMIKCPSALQCIPNSQPARFAVPFARDLSSCPDHPPILPTSVPPLGASQSGCPGKSNDGEGNKNDKRLPIQKGQSAVIASDE